MAEEKQVCFIRPTAASVHSYGTDHSRCANTSQWALNLEVQCCGLGGAFRQRPARSPPLYAPQRNTARLEQLLELQAAAQAKWSQEKVFEANAPASGMGASHPSKLPSISPAAWQAMSCMDWLVQERTRGVRRSSLATFHIHT